MDLIFWVMFSGIAGFLLFASIASFLEIETRAGLILIFLFLFYLACVLVPYLLLKNTYFIELAFLLVAGLCLGLFFIPTRKPGISQDFTGLKRIHEEDAVLSRRLLQPGTSSYESYYKMHPEQKEADDRSRKNPGLLSVNSKYYEPLTFNSSKAAFTLTEHLHAFEEPEISKSREEHDPKRLTRFISEWLRKCGAADVGFTTLKDHHLYSHKGRGKKAGMEILNDLPNAIAITVEMDHSMMEYAPEGPTVMESSEQYLLSGILATKLALMISNLGYRAKAHIDGNYEVICPLVASDAGMGVIGRMGLLMTPRLGPRVRVSVVTTDIPVEYSQARKDFSPLAFCEYCTKCARVCPVNAIPGGSREEIEGHMRWKINSEACYNYWTISGTDCGKCMISCPYAHRDTSFHRFIRWGIKNNLLFRRMAVKLDNVFYGKGNASCKSQDWLMNNREK